MFSTQPFIDFSTEQCPMLIGIQRLCQKEKDGLFSTKYQFQSLLKGDTLTRTQEKSTRAVLLGELRIFKKECNDNELALVSLRTLIITYLLFHKETVHVFRFSHWILSSRLVFVGM